LDLTGSNISGVTNINSSGTITATSFSGNGAALTGIVSTTAQTVTTNAQPNITSVGTLTSLVVSGTANLTNTILDKYNETVVAGGSVSGTITPDAAAGTIFNYTLTGNITLNALSNVVAGTSVTLILTQDGSGNRQLTSNMKWSGGSKTLSTAANSIDIVGVFYDGTTYYASLSKGYA
jgi:hypothetical protein